MDRDVSDLVVSSGLKTDCEIESMSDDEWSSEEDLMQQLEEDITTWLDYCRVAERIVCEHLVPNGTCRYLFPTTRCSHIFML